MSDILVSRVVGTGYADLSPEQLCQCQVQHLCVISLLAYSAIEVLLVSALIILDSNGQDVSMGHHVSSKFV